MIVHWSEAKATEVPAGDDWLSSAEREIAKGLRFVARRNDWRLGRFTAKRALIKLGAVTHPDGATIKPAEDGAPEVWLGGTRLERTVSISHRAGLSAVTICKCPVGCDLEVVEPRPALFTEDFFTDTEREALVDDLTIALYWSAKESVLKVLRTGLRRDTRSVEIVKVARGCEGWCRLEAVDRETKMQYTGWWCMRRPDVVLTVMTAEPTEPPHRI